MSEQPRVALYQGSDRTQNLRQTLEAIWDQVDWTTKRHVLLKPNLVHVHYPHAITHNDALQLVLEMIREHYDGPLTLAEGCALISTPASFALLEYERIAAFYGAQLLDLNADETVPVVVYRDDALPLRLRLARTIVESDCRISLTLPKTHDAVLVTLSIKNMIMGTLVNKRMLHQQERPRWLDRIGSMLRGHGNGWGSDKVAMHQSYPIMNLNLALLAPYVRPHLSIIDGFTAMEGEGPITGSAVPWGIALAGVDPLAVDSLAAQMMGFKLQEVGYLAYCAQLGLGCADTTQIRINGNVAPEAVTRRFLPHPRHDKQRRWQHPQAAELLQRGFQPRLAD